MGGVNSACLKPRSAPKDEDDRGRHENEGKKRALTVLTSIEASNAETTTTKMNNGDAVMGVETARVEKQKKRHRKKRELSHAFQLHTFQSQDDMTDDASKTASVACSEG